MAQTRSKSRAAEHGQAVPVPDPTPPAAGNISSSVSQNVPTPPTEGPSVNTEVVPMPALDHPLPLSDQVERPTDKNIPAPTGISNPLRGDEQVPPCEACKEYGFAPNCYLAVGKEWCDTCQLFKRVCIFDRPEGRTAVQPSEKRQGKGRVSRAPSKRGRSRTEAPGPLESSAGKENENIAVQASGEKEGANGKDEGVQGTKDEITKVKEEEQVPEEKAAEEKTKKNKKKKGGRTAKASQAEKLAVPPSHIVEVSPREEDVPEPTTQDPLHNEGGEIILFTAAKQYIAEVCSSNTQQLDDLKKKINEGAVHARSVGTQKQWQILANELSSLSQRSTKTDKKITEAIKTLDQLIKDLKGINSGIESLAVKSDEFDSENSSLKRQKHKGDMQHKLSSLISSTLSAGRASSISSNNAPGRRKVSAESSKAGMAPKRVKED